MKFNPNTMKTKEDAQLALIDQGYEEIDTHPALRHYDAETGEMTAEAREAFGVEDFAIPQESTPKERPLTQREIKKFAQVAIAGPRVTINEQGVVLTSQKEVDAVRNDDEFAGRY